MVKEEKGMYGGVSGSSYCPVCGGNRMSKLHRSQSLKCAAELKRRIAEGKMAKSKERPADKK